jgi:hypothetical protein
MRAFPAMVALLVVFFAVPTVSYAQGGPPGGAGGGFAGRISALEASVTSLQTTVAALQSAVAALQGAAGGLKLLSLTTAGDEATTTTRDFEDLPGLTATIQPTTTGCLTVTLSSQVQTMLGFSSSPYGVETTAPVDFTVLLDGTPMPGHFTTTPDPDRSLVGNAPGTISQIFIQNSQPQLVAFTFSQCDVAAGSHTVSVRWKCPYSDFYYRGHLVEGRCSAAGRTLTVVGN